MVVGKKIVHSIYWWLLPWRNDSSQSANEEQRCTTAHKKQQQQKDTNHNKKDDEKLTVVTYTGQYIIAECQSKNWNVRCVSSDMMSECHSEQRVVGLTHWRNHKVDTTGENVCQLETQVEAPASNDTTKWVLCRVPYSWRTHRCTQGMDTLLNHSVSYETTQLPGVGSSMVTTAQETKKSKQREPTWTKKNA